MRRRLRLKCVTYMESKRTSVGNRRHSTLVGVSPTRNRELPKMLLDFVESFKQTCHRVFVNLLAAGESGLVLTVVDTLVKASNSRFSMRIILLDSLLTIRPDLLSHNTGTVTRPE